VQSFPRCILNKSLPKFCAPRQKRIPIRRNAHLCVFATLTLCRAEHENDAISIRPVVLVRKQTAQQFFVLVFALSMPFWLIGALIDWQFFPGIPISALAIVAPGMAAVICKYHREGRHAVTRLLARLVDWRQIAPLWVLPILCLMPVCLLLAYLLMRFLTLPLPEPHVELLAVPILFPIFLLAACCEELGWSGYATDLLQQRLGALSSALILGVVWAAWHIVPLVEAQRAIDWIAWWCLGTIALRVLHVWIYNNTGKSVAGAAVFHASYNVSWQLFPNRGSHYDPEIASILLIVLAAIVVFIYGAKHLRVDRQTSK
jgi:membrane protease YdiL (CAAX protease family)